MHGTCDVLETCGGAMHAQAGNLARFNRNFRKWKNLSFPEPIFPLITTDVLVRRCSRVCLSVSKFALLKSFCARLGASEYCHILVDMSAGASGVTGASRGTATCRWA